MGRDLVTSVSLTAQREQVRHEQRAVSGGASWWALRRRAAGPPRHPWMAVAAAGSGAAGWLGFHTAVGAVE